MYRTEPRHTTDRPEDPGAAAKPICRRLVSIEQAAELACVLVEQVWGWIMTGKVEAYRLHAGRIRVDEFELADFLSAR